MTDKELKKIFSKRGKKYIPLDFGGRMPSFREFEKKFNEAAENIS